VDLFQFRLFRGIGVEQAHKVPHESSIGGAVGSTLYREFPAAAVFSKAENSIRKRQRQTTAMPIGRHH
jgi:hypothetical protein